MIGLAAARRVGRTSEAVLAPERPASTRSLGAIRFG